ncbi:hypothetical protein [Mycobacterium deserti]|uniref:Secreted protein n=1 Tax=Mycobacterium deserti TaxID=2978347 RepID=A0ABT2M9Q5_9MYCO|nr:hypothetical protein [Mycobacterium deserti]MCT7657736.1 hypothetical protein [Mycobacterium deserti]
MKRLSRFATAVVVAGGMAAAGLASGTGTATAQGPSYNGGNCPQGMTCTHWCPGDPVPPGSQVVRWDWNVCHDWYWNSEGIVDVISNTMYPWSGAAPHPAAPPPPLVGTPPPPLQKPPGTPFCSPRGALIIIPPICDEIGVDWPPGSVRR